MGDRVVLAMSGGVDSSAAAVLLHEQGYEVIGLFMRSGETETACALPSEPKSLLPVMNAANRQGCCSSEDAADARRVADRMGIPFHSLNFQDDFRRIKDYFADEYLAGRTPNPCVQCNNWLKFGKLWDFARQVDAQYIATGHYARIRRVDSAKQEGVHREGEAPAEPWLSAPRGSAGAAPSQLDWGLFRGDDDNKDQSYVLFGIRRELLPNILLPIGTFQKPAIRELARESGLRVADKKDSYEICFVPDQDYAGFLKRYRGYESTAGNFVDTSGRILGQHDGYEQFTVGQRKGLGVAFGEPRFVVRIEPVTRRVVLGLREDLATSSIKVRQLNWLVDPPTTELRCGVKVRYRSASEPCSVTVHSNHTATITPDSSIIGVAPGQAAVFYDGDRVLGGGWIA